MPEIDDDGPELQAAQQNPFSPAASPSNMGMALEAMLNRMASMVEASTNAASIAATAVQSMHNAQSAAGAKAGLEGRDLLKILPKPEPFKVDKAEDEHSRWHSWYWVFRQFLVAVDQNFDAEISEVERSLNNPVLIVSAEQQARSFQLYALLSTLIKGRAFQTVKQINHQQGYEALRMLLLQFQPEPYLPQILELERAFEQYSLASGVMRQHICASLPEDASYNRLQKGKGKGGGKGKGKDTKGGKANKGKGKGGGKGKAWSAQDWKGNAKGSKGKDAKGGKGKGKGGSMQVQSGPTQVQSGPVQVQSGPTQVQSGSVEVTGQEVCNMASCTGPRSGQAPASAASASWYDMSCTDDDAQWTRCSDECASDMSFEAIAAPVRGVIRVAGFRPEIEPLPVVEEVTEVVLDSGADESCLPYAYAGVGCKASTNQRANFSDAQGNPLRAYGWRYAQVILDNGVTFRERFLVTDVTSPLLACGKLYKAGWSVQHENNELVLSKGSRKVPVRFRHNSLVVDGSIRTVTSKPSDGFVRAVSLNPVLESMVNKGNEFFEELIPGVQGLKCESDAYLDVSLYLPMEGMQYRTTLVCVDPVMRIWELWELCRDVTTLDVLDEQFADGVERTVLTIASREALTAEQLGIVMQGDVQEAPDGATDVPMQEGEGEPAGVAQEVGGIGSPPPFESTVPGTPDLEALFASDVEGEKQHHDGANVPVAQQAALEAATRDDEMTGDFIEVNGVRVTADSALSVMRKACEYLNIGRSGGKAKVYKRLCDHLKRLELAEGVRQKQERAQGESREPREVPLVKEPTLHERLQHNLTHAPYREWCEHCVMHKARSDRASATVEPKRAVSVLSFDFGFTGRELDPENKLITLCVKDRATGWREAIPTKRKGGPESTKFLTSEIVRLCNVLGYNDVTIRCDPEPSCKTLQQEVQKARGRLGQRTRLEQSGEEEKASNGAAEEAVESTRQQACVLLSAYEHNTGKQVGSLHPLHAWAARHGSWLLNRYVVARDQQTPFECTFQSPYTGKLVEFGECVMAMCRTAMTNKPVKGSAKWVRSLWLGKANASDGHLVVTAGGKLLITRSIRRTPERWDPSLHDCIKDFPWDHPGFVAGGLGKMRKQREAKPVEAVAEPTADEVGVLGPVSPLLAGPGDEAASDPETSLNYSPSLPASEHKSNGPDGSAGSSTSSSSSSDDDGSGTAAGNAPAEQPDAAMQGVEAEVPQGVAGVPSAGGDANAEERPAKAAKLRAVTQNEFYHNDASIDFNFEDAELDELEGYDYGLADYYFSEEAGGSDAPPDELWRPFGPTEPSLSEAEMLMIDSAADDFEIRRLLAMHVLEALTCDAAEQAQTEGSRLLSTKFVRSWRIKMRKLGDGTEQQQYLRRSRFVGREYAWMDKDRTELFAPASSSLLTRLLPSAFMRSKGEGHACCVLDVADAFLTVDQRIPTVVKASLGDQQSHVQHFRLLKLLPGQRDGTIRWHESFTEYLDSKLGLEPYVPCPALFKLKNVAVAGLLHVDDLFSEGQRKGLNVMVSCVQDKYKCTVSWLCEHGDEVSFLKKAYRLVRDDLLIIQPHPRHVEKLVEMFNLTRARSKSSPLPTTLPTDDEELTGEQSSMFRTAVGVLLYLQADVIEAQFGIRWLAQHMSRPTTGALRVLKHMILYLRDTSGYAIGFPVPTIGIGVSVQSKAGHDVLETHTDADWAGDKVHRKSVSGCVITLNSHLLSSSSRTQKSIALSSGESEYASAVSGTCDQVFIRNAVEFVLGTKVESHLLLDSAAARGVIARQGAGRIRHLEAKMLWLQQYARESLQVHPVDGKHNVSDLGTKSLQGPRIKALLHKVGIRDANDDYALVGSEEFQNLLDGNTVRKLVRLVKQQGNAGNSVGLQVAMIVLSHALSQHAVAAAADSEEQDVGADDGTDGMHSIVQQVLEMIMLVFTFAGEYAQLYPIAATSFMQGFMWMILMCLGWCVCRRRNVILSMRGDASGDDGMSPASPRGARSKRMTKPPKRSCGDSDDEGARGESANAGDVPMSSHESPGRLNFNVPLTPGASVKLEVSSGSASDKPSSSAASTSSTGDADVPRARRPPARPKPKARNSDDDEVWVSGAQGYCYHKAGCGKLNQSNSVTSTTRRLAESRGYRGCRICNP
ncbi:unnamed protein product [Symbiodinium sp. CCMP2592]|nr:unnamed protein product [Symbiodinium sp. CCMP2592]